MSSTPEQLNAAIKAQGDVVRQLKADKATAEQLAPELASLSSLKAELNKIRPEEPKGKGKAKKAFTLKTPKAS